MNCPNCGNHIEADFGMVTCPHCQSVVLVDIEGVAHQATAEPTPQGDFQNQSPNLAANDDRAEEVENFQNFESAGDNGFYDPVDPGFNSGENPGINLGIDPGSDAEIAAEIALEPHQDIESSGSSEDDPAPAFGRVMEPPPQKELSFNEYANSEKDLPALTYTVRISGLDHPQRLREALEVIRDPKLGIIEDVSSRIQATGDLDLERLTAVKASYLVKKLLIRRIPVSWRQNVFN